MVEFLLLRNVWFVTFLWGLVYLSDYYLTIYSAREFYGRLGKHIRFEGSYELTPAFEKDIDRLRLFSPAFFSRLLISLALIPAIFYISLYLFEDVFLYLFLIGALFLRGVAIHMRHLRNISMAVLTRQPGSMRGEIAYSRWLNLRMSALELLGFGVFFLIAAAIDRSWFFLGGGIITTITGFQHWLMTRKLKPALPAAETIQ